MAPGRFRRKHHPDRRGTEAPGSGATYNKDAEVPTVHEQSGSTGQPGDAKPSSAGVLCSIIVALLAPALAQAVDVSATERVASGLNNPRGIAFAPNGALFVAESGNGGPPADASFSNCTPSPVFPNPPRCYGESGAITQILEGGGYQRVVTGLPSLGLATGSGEGGPVDISFHGMAAYVTFSWGGDPANRAASLGPKQDLFGHLARVTPGGVVQRLADVAGHETANNPAGGPVDSNPYGVLAQPGRRVVADAGANALIEVGTNGHTRTLAVIPRLPGGPTGREPVPTSVVEGPDGALYVGLLGSFPFFAGSSPVLRVASDGSTIETHAAGFTAIVDLAFDAGGALYVLEVASGQQAPFPPPNPGLGIGRLVRQCPAGGPREVLVTGLTFPGGVATGPNGAVYLTNFGTHPTLGEVRRMSAAACP